MGGRTTLVLLFALGLIWHGLLAFTVPWPVDWDPSYYQSVATHILQGDGQVTGSVWHLVAPPAALPYPAHLHWMPLPVWVLLPGLALWASHGAQLVTVALGASWAPLAERIANALGASPRQALLAGLVACTGLGWVRFLSTPDSIALYGALGGLGTLALLRRWDPVLLAVAALAALTRNEGALLGLMLGLLRGGPVGVGCMGIALASTAGWTARNAAVGGAWWLEQRAAVSAVQDARDLLQPGSAPASLFQRGFAGLTGLQRAGMAYLLYLPAPALLGAWWQRRSPAGKLYLTYLPLAGLGVYLVAPGVAESGSVYRTASALAPLSAALFVLGLAKLDALAVAKRDFFPGFVAGILGLASLAVPVCGLGWLAWVGQGSPPTCETVADLPPGAVVFSTNPLALEARCGVHGVVLPASGSALPLAERYHIAHALLDGLSPARLQEALPGWVDGGHGLASPPSSAAPAAHPERTP